MSYLLLPGSFLRFCEWRVLGASCKTGPGPGPTGPGSRPNGPSPGAQNIRQRRKILHTLQRNKLSIKSMSVTFDKCVLNVIAATDPTPMSKSGTYKEKTQQKQKLSENCRT